MAAESYLVIITCLLEVLVTSMLSARVSSKVEEKPQSAKYLGQLDLNILGKTMENLKIH